ncbi:galactose-specific lectin nattectin-like [Dunckerocampus dactyliophorus]|uniref:galactose-specific lectin nattectin-like n=1 Tax=Dunckerocampus dactyliophorus TaxID=161453 RepID=UPI002405C699|nr:galactose-specific lectin nattectin-like [Dunckerocampus dactyliophorus]
MTGQNSAGSVNEPQLVHKVCPSPWISHDNRCFLYESVDKTWHDAEKHCVAQGGHLASAHSHATIEFFQGLIPRYGVWIGGHKENDVWKWADGSQFDVKPYHENRTHARWQKYHPYDEDCMEQYRFSLLQSSACIYRQAFICQK